MKTILTINPKKIGSTKKNKTARKKNVMAKKRTKKRTTARKNPAPIKRRRRRARANPSRTRSAARKATTILSGLKIPTATVNALKATGGMLAAQFAAKRFAEGGGANEQEWSWKNYAFGVGGAFAAGIGGELIKKGSGHEFLKGGLSLMMYKFVTNELAQKSEWINSALGEESAYILGTDGQYRAPGEEYIGDAGETYILGEDGYWNEADAEISGNEDYYDEMSGSELAPPGVLGGTLAPPGELGDAYADTFGGEDDSYKRAFGEF